MKIFDELYFHNKSTIYEKETLIKISLNLSSFTHLRILSLLRPLVFLILLSHFVKAQSGFVTYDDDYYHRIERLEVISGKLANTFHDNVKPFERKDIVQYLDSLNFSDSSLTTIDKENLNYLRSDSWAYNSDTAVGKNKKPFWKHFFKYKADFYSVKNEDFNIHVNPIFQFGGGSNAGDIETEGQFINTRGISVHGTVNKKLGFYTFFTENQASTPFYIKDYQRQTGGFPFTGFTKIIKDDSVKLGRDYMQAMGYFVFKPSKNIKLRFGHSTNFIGSGIRSMILSDFSAPYLNLMVNVKMGRLEYQTLIASMNNTQVDVGVATLEAIPPKYMAFHHLNVNVSKKLNIGLFETVMFGERAFDLNYLNPVIFYRFVEGLRGSRDNAIVGADFKFILAKSLSFYGQFVLDEFNSAESKEEGWYGEKHAGQLGLKYIDFLGLKQFDLQAEFNYARPYTYSHFSTYTNAVNYNVPLAHPLGANFKEFLLLARYQPTPKLFLKATWMKAIKGLDTEEENWGGDVLRNYREDRPDDFGNFIGQGIEQDISLLRFEASYMLGHNFFLDLAYQNRLESYQILNDKKTTLLNFGLRWNLANRKPLL